MSSSSGRTNSGQSWFVENRLLLLGAVVVFGAGLAIGRSTAPTVRVSLDADAAQSVADIQEFTETMNENVQAWASDLEQTQSKQAAAAEIARKELAAFVFRDIDFEIKEGLFGGMLELRASAQLYNGSPETISAVRVKLSLKTPGREVPWATEDDYDSIAGGAEPGETVLLDLNPDFLSSALEKAAANNAQLHLELLSVLDADSNTIWETGETVW